MKWNTKYSFFQILYPQLTKIYEKEEENFINSEEYKAFSNPCKELSEYFSSHIEEPVDLTRMTYLTSGVKLLVRNIDILDIVGNIPHKNCWVNEFKVKSYL